MLRVLAPGNPSGHTAGVLSRLLWEVKSSNVHIPLMQFDCSFNKAGHHPSQEPAYLCARSISCCNRTPSNSGSSQKVLLLSTLCFRGWLRRHIQCSIFFLLSFLLGCDYIFLLIFSFCSFKSGFSC